MEYDPEEFAKPTVSYTVEADSPDTPTQPDTPSSPDTPPSPSRPGGSRNDDDDDDDRPSSNSGVSSSAETSETVISQQEYASWPLPKTGDQMPGNAAALILQGMTEVLYIDKEGKKKEDE